MDGPQADVCHCLCSALRVITEIDVHVCRHLLHSPTAATPTTRVHTQTHGYTQTHTLYMHEAKTQTKAGISVSSLAQKICWARGSLNVYIRVHFVPRQFAAGQLFGLFFTLEGYGNTNHEQN